MDMSEARIPIKAFVQKLHLERETKYIVIKLEDLRAQILIESLEWETTTSMLMNSQNLPRITTLMNPLHLVPLIVTGLQTQVKMQRLTQF